jgi:prophage antirepressor-like protein
MARFWRAVRGAARLAGAFPGLLTRSVRPTRLAAGKAVQSNAERKATIMANTAPTGATAPAVFNFQSHEVRVVVRNGDPWFVASDVSDVLKYRNAPDMTRFLDDDEIGTTQIVRSNERGNPNVTIISESGLYHAIGLAANRKRHQKSRKPKFKTFRRWVTGKVLPAIRKTGISPAHHERIQPAYALSAEAIGQVSRVVFDSVMGVCPDSEWWKHERFLLCFTYDMQPYVKLLDRDAFTVSLSRLAEMIVEPNGMLPTNAELTHLAAACCQRLAQQFRRET